MGTIMVITQPNVTAAMALAYDDIIISAAHMVHKGVIDIAENNSWERLKIQAVPLVRYMC